LGIQNANAEQRVMELGEDVRIAIDVSAVSIDVSTHEDRTLAIAASDLSHLSIVTRGQSVLITGTAAGSGRLELSVYPNVQLEISTRDSRVSVNGIKGPVTVRNHTQPVTVTDVDGAVSVATWTGPVLIERVNGDVAAMSNTNSVHIKGIHGDVNARSTTSSVTLEDSDSTVVDLRSVSGDVRYAGNILRHGRYRLGTYSGMVTLQIPRRSNATIDLRGNPRAFVVEGAQLEEAGEESGRVRIGEGRGLVEAESALGGIHVLVR